MDANPTHFERNPDGAYLLTSNGQRARNEWPGVQEAFEWYSAALTLELQRAGFCAGFFSDQLEVARRGESVFEGYHVHNRGGGNVIFDPPKYEDSLAKRVQTDPAPVTGCPDEAPPFDRARLHVRFLASVIVDATPLGRGEDWCKSQGFLDPDLSGQGWCPYGAEGQAQREACEAREGPWSWSFREAVGTQPAEPEINNGNPLQVRLPITAVGLVTLCARNGACSTVVVQP